MDKFTQSIDLASLAGAQYVNGKSRPRRQGESEESYARVPSVPGIFIPIDPNGIQVTADTRTNADYRNPSGVRAYISTYVGPLEMSSQLVAKGFSHEVSLSMPEEVKEALVEKYRRAVVSQHPEWSSLDLKEKGADGKYIHREFRAAVYKYIPSSIGLQRTVAKKVITPSQTASFSEASLPAEVVSAVSSPASTAYTYPSQPQASIPTEVASVDDLPF